MKQSIARELIRTEYIKWKQNPNNMEHNDPKFNFFCWLEQNRANLLDFKYSGSDKWQSVVSMLSGLE